VPRSSYDAIRVLIRLDVLSVHITSLVLLEGGFRVLIRLDVLSVHIVYSVGGRFSGAVRGAQGNL
jgi:hypothetical protein